MEDNNVQLIPTFDEEIVVNIKSLGEIESNIKDIKEKALKLNNYYSNITFTDDSIKVAKDIKSKVNKFKGQVSDYRKNIIAEFKKPIEQFETTAKETEKILGDTYTTINLQCNRYDDEQKKKLEKEVREFFDEYKATLNINVPYEKANITVNLNSSLKKLKDEAVAFLEKVNKDLELINSQQYKDEILVEYNTCYDAVKAITTVNNRMKAIEEQKNRNEELIHRTTVIIGKQPVETISEKEDILQAPQYTRINNISSEKVTMTFTVTGTIEEIKKLRAYLINSNIEFRGGN